MDKSILYTKSFDLTIAVYKKVTAIKQEYLENQLADWLFQDVSSISLNLYIANQYKSRRSLLIKLYIAKRSSARALFWVELLRKVDLFAAEDLDNFASELTEILKMASASINTMSKKKPAKK